MTEQPSDEQIIAKYLELRDLQTTLENQHKLELMPIKRNMGILEEVMSIRLAARVTPKDPFPKAKTEVGTAYKKRIFSVKIEDKPVFLKFAFANDMKLLDIRASESGIEDHIDLIVKENLNLPEGKKINPAVPGISTSRFDKVIFRRSG